MPVPTSTTARAATAEARKRRAAPTPGETGSHPSTAAAERASAITSSSGEVELDEIGGVGAVHGHKGY